MTTRNRLFFLDNLKVFALVMVIAHHAGQAYGPTGGAWPIGEPVPAAVLGPFFTVNRSFGMSLFFLIAGYFTVLSCDRSGPRAFLVSRLWRLGLPLLVLTGVMMALQVFLFGAQDGHLGSPWPVEMAHLWFVQHLLVYSVVYALWRIVRPRTTAAERPLADPPGYGRVLLFALGIAVALAVVRTWFPIDRLVYILGWLRVAWADVPRDLALFVAGGLAYRHQWLTRFPTRAGMIWLGVGLFLAALRYGYDLWLQTLVILREPLLGALGDIWEAVLCCALCIGLTVLFREAVNGASRLFRWLAQGQYAAYIVHVFIVLGFQALLVGLPVPALLKFALVTVAAVPVSFLIGGLVRKPLRL